MAKTPKNITPEQLFERAQVYFEDGEFEEAEAELLKGRELAESTNNVAALGSILNMLSGVYRETGRLEEALAACLEAIRLAKSADLLPVHIGYLHDNAGQILSHLERPKEAFPHFKEAAELLVADPEEADYMTMVRSLLAMAEIHMDEGQNEEAGALVMKALRVSREESLWDDVTEACSLLLELLADDDRAEDAVKILDGVLAQLEEELSEPANPLSVMEPTSMIFEMLKDEHQKSGSAPFFMIKLLIFRSRARAMMDVNDGLPAGLPTISPLQVEMLKADHEQLAQSYLDLGIELHFLAQEATRPTAFEAAEAYYRHAADVIRGSDDEELIEEFLENIFDNLVELFEDTDRDPELVEV